jgi:plasmid stabilization system protein ParE
MAHSVRLTHGVWRDAATVTDLAARCAALLTAAPDGAVISGISAARLHGLWLPEVAASRVELILRQVAAGADAYAGTRRPEIHGRRRTLRPDEVTVVAGMPVQTRARAWTDLAEHLCVPDLVAAGDSALRAGCSRAELAEMVSRARGRRGVVRARRALPLLNSRSRSRPETHLRVALVLGGLPEPAVNQPIHSTLGEWLSEPDLSYDDVRLALEYDGAVHATTERMRKDITRELDVGLRGGWRTVTFGPAQVFGRPDQCVTYVRQLRRERTPVRMAR